MDTKAYSRDYYQRNRDKFLIYNKKYRFEHSDKASIDIQRQRSKDCRKNLRNKLIDILGYTCVRCGFTDIRALQIDHINGGGTREIKIIGEYKMIKQYLEDPIKAKEYLQILCANCNWIKRAEKNETRK